LLLGSQSAGLKSARHLAEQARAVRWRAGIPAACQDCFPLRMPEPCTAVGLAIGYSHIPARACSWPHDPFPDKHGFNDCSSHS